MRNILAAMEERIHLLGGKFKIQSTPGNGTTVTAWVPLALNNLGELRLPDQIGFLAPSGAPQVGFSESIRKIKARTSLLTRFRPPYLADSGDPRPIQTKPGAMPVHDGSRSDQDERLPPPGPRSQRNPEQLVQGR
jgi:hypothetical protein